MKHAVTWEKEFAERFTQRFDELKRLYCEVYNNDLHAFHWLAEAMHSFYTERDKALRELDRRREQAPFWYSTNDLVGMMLYVDNFAGDLGGVRSKIDYLKESGIIDPAKVTRVALENAASIAGMFLATECVICDAKEDKPELPAGAPGMGGMM